MGTLQSVVPVRVGWGGDGAEGLHVPDGAVSLQKGYRKEDFLSL